MIEVKHLFRDYGDIRAVDNVSFNVNKGEILGFLGPNGAGKTTTMRMIAGFLPPTEGTALIGGYDIQEYPIEAKRQLGYLPENGPLYPEMTPLEFLQFIGEVRHLHGDEFAKAVTRAIEICHLEEVRHQPIDTLSKGYRQRVGMAQALIHDPNCLILDEPTNGLDPNQKREVRKLITQMVQEKVIVLSTHVLEEVEALCSRIIIIDKGSIVIDATPEELRQRHPRHHALRLCCKSEAIEPIQQQLNTLSSVHEVMREGEALIVIPKPKQNVGAELWKMAREANWPVTALEKAPVSLEEVFWNLTQSETT